MSSKKSNNTQENLVCVSTYEHIIAFIKKVADLSKEISDDPLSTRIDKYEELSLEAKDILVYLNED